MKADNYFNEIMRIKELVYTPNNLCLDDVECEKGHHDYGAFVFTLNEVPIKFRVAKITPIKIGCFVAIWKRDSSGGTIPYDAEDPFEFYIIHVMKEEKCGQFIFPKNILLKNNILSLKGKGGKRGFRLYPAWDKPESKQAKKTQAWQLPFFFEIKDKGTSLPEGVLGMWR